MILDNENENLKVHEWISKYTKAGKLNVVTGYFTIGALAYLSQCCKENIDEFKFVLGDIVNFDADKDRALDLLNENINIEASLKLSKAAQEAVAFLELDKVNAKTLEPNFCHAKVYLYKDNDNDAQKHYYVTGSSNLTEAGIGLKATNNVELNFGSFGSDAEYGELVKWFDSLWRRPQAHNYKTIIEENGKEKKVPFKQYLIDQIKKIFIEYTPKQLFYKVLFELFGNELLLEKDNPEFNRQIGRLENSVIYNSLYEFQQKGALSLIKMLEKFNGAILADAVGLGKTWTALAVIKFYQLKGREVIVICPKKLQYNWRKYKKHHNSKFEADHFEFFIRYHTDLNEGLMDKYTDRSDKLLINEKPKLFVIDESHNLRNDKSKRYKFLVDEILSRNEDAKILMLSATPINNSLMDIRNQFKLIVAGKANGFEESLDIKNIDYTFRMAQKSFNDWVSEPEPRIGDLIKKLPANFFTLTDSLTVARIRKMIEGEENGLKFPFKTKPQNIFVTPNQIGNFESFEELFDHFPPMLSAYQPSYYVDDFDNADILHDEKQRDRFLVKMLYILLVKRLESSWFSFYSTVNKILDHHQNALNRIKDYQKSKKEFGWNDDEQLSLFQDDELADEIEDFTLGKKRKTRLIDIDRSGKLEAFKKDLKEDIESLQLLQSNLNQFEKKIAKEIKKVNNQKSEDDKLETVIDRIIEKRNNKYNNGNNKVIIFTVYKDTAFYLFDQLTSRGFDKVAVVSGGSSRVSDEEGETKNFEPILERFAPYTKLFREKEWKTFQSSLKDGTLIEQFEEWQTWLSETDNKTYQKIKKPIDILIATDTLSEGQNLQDCDMVINYDIHWNPVRVIQRLGRIDRLGSPNEKIFGINFWPSNNINSYLNLQGRIEQRMATMKLAGSEVDLQFSDTFREMVEDEDLEQKQKARMMEQMQSSWDDIEVNNQGLGFDNLSLEGFRQDLLEELEKNEDYYKLMPNGVYTGFIANKAICPAEGIIALMGYPSKPQKEIEYKYKGYELIYIDMKGKAVFLNQKEVLDALSKHKEESRFVTKGIDEGEPKAIQQLSDALSIWLKSQVVEEELQEDGTIKHKIGKATMDLIGKLKAGGKQTGEKIKREGPPAKKYTKENFDLITWFIIT